MSAIKSRAREIFLQMLRAESEPDMPKEPILKVVVPLLEELGFSIGVLDNDGNPVIYAQTPNPRFMLSGHLDTVNMGSGWTKPHAEEKDGRIYGRGALDMKGPCLSMLLAAEELLEEGMGMILCFTTDEEVGMAGAKAIAAEHPEMADLPLVIICEPTELRPVFEEKGLVQFQLVTSGVNAHGSMPEEGRNAIMDLVKGIEAIGQSRYFGEYSTDPVTINVGLVQGGTLINMIPDSATAEFDIRYSPDHAEEGILSGIREILNPLEIDYEMKVVRRIPPASSGLTSEERRSLGGLFELGSPVPYATEMAVFGKLNDRIMILGPGEVDRAHKPDEYMTMQEVFTGAEALVKTVKTLAPEQ